MFLRTLTLGCKVNQYETEFLRQGLLRLGWQDAADGEVATLVVVNTCTVTAESDQKSRKAIRKLIKENPGAEVVVMGCLTTRNPKAIAAIPGVSRIITDKRDIPNFLRQQGLQDIPTGLETFGERHRAFVKVQDGCQAGCSYCIIPKVRPTLRSRPVAEVLDEIRTLSCNGYREIVLTGIHLGHYGLDFSHGDAEARREDLASLVRRIIELDEPFRLRISSLEAVEVSDELVDLMAANPRRICPHLHLSMQSGSDAVLRRMKRRWLCEPFVRRCEEILARFDRLALTTDVIVGFPGETEAEFSETLRVVEHLQFSKVHVFRFSPREGTEAATMPHRIPPPIQQRRAAELGELTDRLRRDYAASLVGMDLSVLLETPHGGTADRYVEVRLAEPVNRLGSLLDVRIDHADGDLLYAAKEGIIQSPPPLGDTSSRGSKKFGRHLFFASLRSEATKSMRVLLLGNGTKPGVLETVALLRPEIERRAEIVGTDFYGQDELPPNDADFAIVFGGDGSILRAAHQMGQRQIPVLAVHLGKLSFLSTVRTDELIPLLDRSDLLSLPIIEHLLLRCEVFLKGHCEGPESARILLNEVLVASRPSGIADIELHIDGELVTTYRGDGLILSTPVGSTAHNLSVGGPILRKDVDAVVISPVGPHTLSNRPLVDSPNRCFELAVKRPATLIIDGIEVAVIDPENVIRIRRAEQTFKTIDVPGYCYYRMLRTKLGWNGSLIDDR